MAKHLQSGNENVWIMRVESKSDDKHIFPYFFPPSKVIDFFSLVRINLQWKWQSKLIE